MSSIINMLGILWDITTENYLQSLTIKNHFRPFVIRQYPKILIYMTLPVAQIFQIRI